MTIQKFVFRLIKRSSGLMMLVMVSVVLLSFQVSGKTFSKQQNVKKQTALISTDKAELDILKKRINIKAVNSNLQVFLDRLFHSRKLCVALRKSLMVNMMDFLKMHS